MSWRNTQKELEKVKNILMGGRRVKCRGTKNNSIEEAWAMISKIQRDIEEQQPLLARHTTCEQKMQKWRNIYKQMKIEKEKE